VQNNLRLQQQQQQQQHHQQLLLQQQQAQHWQLQQQRKEENALADIIMSGRKPLEVETDKQQEEQQQQTEAMNQAPLVPMNQQAYVQVQAEERDERQKKEADESTRAIEAISGSEKAEVQTSEGHLTEQEDDENEREKISEARARILARRKQQSQSKVPSTGLQDNDFVQSNNNAITITAVSLNQAYVNDDQHQQRLKLPYHEADMTREVALKGEEHSKAPKVVDAATIKEAKEHARYTKVEEEEEDDSEKYVQEARARVLARRKQSQSKNPTFHDADDDESDRDTVTRSSTDAQKLSNDSNDNQLPARSLPFPGAFNLYDEVNYYLSLTSLFKGSYCFFVCVF